jgi:hypothetical protein
MMCFAKIQRAKWLGLDQTSNNANLHLGVNKVGCRLERTVWSVEISQKVKTEGINSSENMMA